MSNGRKAVLELRNVCKHFAGIAALNDISFDVAPGEVLCLLGDNGAGKSTLIKILSGVHRPTSGDVFVDGKPVDLRVPRDAQDLGIATVHQDVGVIALMSVSRNFFLGVEPTKGWGPFKRIDQKTADSVVLEQMTAMGIRRVRDGGQLVGVMSGGEKQALAIARAIYFGGRVLILDEPTSALGVKEAEIVLRLIHQARANGIAVILITHNVHHALSVADHYVVLIHGEVAADFRQGEKTREEILDLMAGGERLQSLAAKMEAGIASPSHSG
ncbi:ATP-binding cassette domain-containing protein [Paraburkholderia bannensis]|uniref:ATP-binding cassette domain-containing protein n=1 Tax=Paraburkholderia bannensis TaxID=765414 RepID=UPI002AC36759|nr:ATP-binding cassette domain-containing protein [Paraburkholderia bannensis]